MSLASYRAAPPRVMRLILSTVPLVRQVASKKLILQHLGADLCEPLSSASEGIAHEANSAVPVEFAQTGVPGLESEYSSTISI